MITAVIPAHNEAERLPATVASLRAQQPAPGRIVVVSDNSTDATVQVAQALGVEVLESQGNRDFKAGALNQFLGADLDVDGWKPGSLYLVMDADTVLADGWLAAALEALQQPMVGAVGAVFHADDARGLLRQLQANEWTRYEREIDRTGRVMVLSGTAALIRGSVLQSVREERGQSLPGRPDTVYDVTSITEDSELTLAIKTLGYQLRSPLACSTETEVMPTWRALGRQRLRWYRGALDNLRAYGWTPVTRRYWLQQAMLSVGVLALWFYVTWTVITMLSGYRFEITPFGVLVTSIFVAERVITVWRGGTKARLIALSLYLELGYEMFLQVVFLRAVFDSITGRRAAWHHVTAPQSQPAAS